MCIARTRTGTDARRDSTPTHPVIYDQTTLIQRNLFHAPLWSTDVLFAGKEASSELTMIHKADVVAKYATETIIGKLQK